jgi:hypothetical protein
MAAAAATMAARLWTRQSPVDVGGTPSPNAIATSDACAGARQQSRRRFTDKVTAG